ncbi:MAG: TRAP transporter large permease subunit [Chloroflexi bacterium]|nr:TRAP transporter large permease subunit [Chloroflexota bacterium]
MPVEIVGLLGVTLAVILMLSGMRIAYATFLIGILGFVMLRSWDAATAMAGILPYTQISVWTYFVIPMFILMGFFLSEAGLADEMFIAAQRWVGHFPGGLALACVVGNAAFAACTGSSAAACAVGAKLLIPQMRRVGYNDRLAAGVVAAAGNLAILIPPSFMMVIYGIITEQSIGALLIGGILPGILSAAVYCVALAAWCKVNPTLGPAIPKALWRERFSSLSGIWIVFIVITIMLGGLYLGVFSATEAGAIGAFGVFVYSLLRRRVTWKMLKTSLRETANLTAMVMVLMLGILTLSNFMSLSGVTRTVIEFIGQWAVNRWVVMFLIIVLYFIMGMFVGSMAMMVLTLPWVFPMVMELGFNPIWFGIIVIKMAEVGAITPPIAFNAFVVNSVVPDIPLQEIYKGCGIFVAMEMFIVAILMAFPAIVTFLPSFMKMG